MGKRLMREVRQARKADRLPPVFRAEDFAAACPGWAPNTYGSFLAKHRVGKKNSTDTKHFVRVSRGLYRLADEA